MIIARDLLQVTSSRYVHTTSLYILKHDALYDKKTENMAAAACMLADSNTLSVIIFRIVMEV